ncbi:hypothetical protein SAMN04489832_3921 [Micromonospora cremea]|uniref:Uncharacterized protein n=1 Tax=Micromonospora cremea TaxID=709881 RepID=A0A1N5ZEJ7_9ACTN|nr:hypothetical protein SAMN04489832_3921 [Micromonospora cremea]
MKAHRTDLVSFAFGLVFLGLSAWWLLAQLLGLALPPVGWFLAGALILIGVFGLVGALRSSRPVQPAPTAPDAVATEPAAPVSGASAPTSGAGLPSWDAERSTWDSPAPGPVPETPTAELRAPETPTAELRAPETPTAELRPAETPIAEVIHPAWLAHPPSEPETTPVADQRADGGDEPTTGLLARPAGAEADEPTRVDHPADERDDQRRES